MPNIIKQPSMGQKSNKVGGEENPIDAILSRHKGVIPESHQDRPAMVAHINELNRSPNTRGEAVRLYSKYISGYADPAVNVIKKGEDNHPKGGLTVSAARKLGIHAGIETHREVEKKGGVSKLSDKTKSRRRSFCARHCGMKRKFPKAYKDPQSKGNKALRVWHCGSCSSWLKKSIGSNDQIEFYQDGNVLDVYMGADVPIEIENILIDSILSKNYVEVDQELNKRCWEGYEPVPGKKPYEKGSCAPVKKEESIDEKMSKLKQKLQQTKFKSKK